MSKQLFYVIFPTELVIKKMIIIFSFFKVNYSIFFLGNSMILFSLNHAFNIFEFGQFIYMLENINIVKGFNKVLLLFVINKINNILFDIFIKI